MSALRESDSPGAHQQTITVLDRNVVSLRRRFIRVLPRTPSQCFHAENSSYGFLNFWFPGKLINIIRRLKFSLHSFVLVSLYRLCRVFQWTTSRYSGMFVTSNSLQNSYNEIWVSMCGNAGSSVAHSMVPVLPRLYSLVSCSRAFPFFGGRSIRSYSYGEEISRCHWIMSRKVNLECSRSWSAAEFGVSLRLWGHPHVAGCPLQGAPLHLSLCGPSGRRQS